MIPKACILLAMLATGASAHDCMSNLNMADVPAAMGTSVKAQPVFSSDRLKGWRLYGTSDSPLLTAQGITEGALMTHVCGVQANEIRAHGYRVCCNADSSREFEVTFRIADEDRKVLITRA
jgi:hypothetical protein